MLFVGVKVGLEEVKAFRISQQKQVAWTSQTVVPVCRKKEKEDEILISSASNMNVSGSGQKKKRKEKAAMTIAEKK